MKLRHHGDSLRIQRLEDGLSLRGEVPEGEHALQVHVLKDGLSLLLDEVHRSIEERIEVGRLQRVRDLVQGVGHAVQISERPGRLRATRAGATLVVDGYPPSRVI